MKKNISLLGAISIGIGGMVGGGIFAVLGEAVSLSHGSTAISFFIAGLVALLTSYSYAKLSVYFMSEGGTVSFVDGAFGDNILSGSINLILWLSYLVTISLYATAFASYGTTFFKQSTPMLEYILISVAIILPALINLISSTFVSLSFNPYHHSWKLLHRSRSPKCCQLGNTIIDRNCRDDHLCSL